MSRNALNGRGRIARFILAVLALSFPILMHGIDASEPNPCDSENMEGGSIGILGGSCPSPMAGNSAPGLQQAFEMTVTAPASAESKAKLGLAEDVESFRPADLETDLFVLLVFDLYCHACQQSAKNMAWLNEQIDNDPRLRKAAVIGLGRGDTPFEVQTFMRKLKLDFPAISDRDKAFTDGLGVDRTPSGFLICRQTGEYRLLASFTGYLSKKKAESFLSPMRKSENSVD
jgi:peroxiredoxin